MQSINFHVHSVSKFTRAICVLAIIGLLDAHLAVMQIWAWASMLNDRIPAQGIELAIDTTFSGEFPCEKCKALAEIKAKETDPDTSPQTPQTDSEQITKLLGILSSTKSNKLHPPECTRIPFLATHLTAPLDFIPAVPSPPPRVV